MKVGLLTFHSAQNYGAVLQAYATQEVLKGLGHEIQVIDYRPPYLIRQQFFPSSKGRPLSIKIKILIEGMLCLYWRYKRRKGFDSFINSRLNLSHEKYVNKSFTSNDYYDAFIMGSDQIWNIKLTHGFDDLYWGNFASKRKVRKISYAASMSNYLLDDEQKQKMYNLLENFNSISVREEELKQFIYNNFKINATTVSDPTFLLGKSKWQENSINPRITKKYVLVYTISLRDEVMRIARLVAKQLNAVILEFTLGVNKRVVFNKYQVATPEEFLGLLENAECVLTSSFHGTAFSIIYNKPFYSVAHGNDKDTRQKTILEKLGLLDRFISRDSNPEFKQIDYGKVNPKLAVLRKESIAFLKNSLSDK